MHWIFKDFKAQLDALEPEVKDKAMEIAEQLMSKKNISKDRAVKQAIKEAEEWFYDANG